MANKCNICKKFISLIDGVKCTKCMGLFHLACLKLSPGHRVSSKWKCHTCKGEKMDSNMPPRSPSSQSLLESNNPDIDRNLCQPRSVEASPGGLAEEVRLAIREEMSLFRDELARICTIMTDYNRRADAIEMRLAALEERVSAGQVQEEARLSSLEERVAKSTVSEDKGSTSEIIANLNNQLNDKEQEYYLTDVDISGVQERNGENITHIVTLIGKKLGVELGEQDVVWASRLGPRHAVLEGETGPRPRAITVRLTRRALRDDLLRAARVRRGADTSGVVDGAARRFYINERLTRSNRQLFYRAREEGRRKGWRYVWTNGGRIFIRRDANATANRIRSEVDLKKFFPEIDG